MAVGRVRHHARPWAGTRLGRCWHRGFCVDRVRPCRSWCMDHVAMVRPSVSLSLRVEPTKPWCITGSHVSLAPGVVRWRFVDESRRATAAAVVAVRARYPNSLCAAPGASAVFLGIRERLILRDAGSTNFQLTTPVPASRTLVAMRRKVSRPVGCPAGSASSCRAEAPEPFHRAGAFQPALVSNVTRHGCRSLTLEMP